VPTFLKSSTIIQDVQDLREAGFAAVAYFYFDFRDTSKQDHCSLLSSILFQLGAQSDAFYHVLSNVISSHKKIGPGSRQRCDDILLQCLKKMLELPERGPVYLIIDALDECPNSSGVRTPRDQVLQTVQDLVKLRFANLHICITSRPEMDIRTILEPLAIHTLCLHEESEQHQDIINYIDWVIRFDPKMRRWREPDKKLVIDALTQKAGAR
jgi:hypothetical protein